MGAEHDHEDNVNRTLQLQGMREILADIDRALDRAGRRATRACDAYMQADEDHEERAFDAMDRAYGAHEEIRAHRAVMVGYIRAAESRLHEELAS